MALFGSVTLPFIVECIFFKIPIYSPVVNPLPPVCYFWSYIFRNIIWWNNKIIKCNGEIVTFCFSHKIKMCHFIKLNVTLFHSFFIQDLSGYLSEFQLTSSYPT